MKIKEWAKRVLCFSLGAVVAALLIINSTSHGKGTEPVRSLEQRVATLEQQVAGLKSWIKAHQEAEAKKERDANKNYGGRN
jgi:outer membrane murein-binding lipoprotein Lpp